MNVLQRIHKCMEQVGGVQKNITVGEGKNSYRAVSHDDVTEALRPLMVKHGLVCWIQKSYPTTESVVFKNKYGERQQFFTKVDCEVVFANVDDPEDRIVVHCSGHGVDSADKSIGKAISYATKYAYMKTFMLGTGEDTDQVHSDDIGTAEKSKADEVREAALLKLAGVAKTNGWTKADVEKWTRTKWGALSIEGAAEILAHIERGGSKE